MKRFSALAITTILTLSACSGGGISSTGVARPPTAAGAVRLRPYALPVVHDSALDASAARGSKHTAAANRNVKTIGSMPTINATVLLTDAPRFGPGAQVNVSLVGVQVTGADGATYQVASYDSPVLVNVLNYQVSALSLGTANLPNQNYTMLRLTVQASDSSLVAYGVTYPVSYGNYDVAHVFTPATADVANIDIPISTTNSGTSISLLAHYNLIEKVKISEGVANLSSAIAAIPSDTAASISGMVVNNAGLAVAQAIVAAVDASGAVVNTALSNDDGTYQLSAMAGGTYTVVVYNNYTSQSGDTFVSNGADYTTSLSGPSVNVPNGYQAALPNIVD